MSGNYTYGEIMKMQEKAAQSAMEMNSRATACRDCSSKSDSTDRISDFHKESTDNICNCSECKNRKCKNNPEYNSSESKNNLSLFQDNDKMLIMALILILSKSSDDKLLLFALMYIMM